MAFTFVVEDGSIVAGANSYSSVDDATAYLEADFKLGPAWAAIDSTDQELLLAMATRYLDENFTWLGTLVDTETPQPLDWPRKGMVNSDGLCVAETVIPPELKNAVARLALHMYTNDMDEDLHSGGVKRFRHDVTEIEWQDGWQGFTHPPFIKRLLWCFGYDNSQLGFKPIIRK